SCRGLPSRVDRTTADGNLHDPVGSVAIDQKQFVAGGVVKMELQPAVHPYRRLATLARSRSNVIGLAKCCPQLIARHTESYRTDVAAGSELLVPRLKLAARHIFRPANLLFCGAIFAA